MLATQDGMLGFSYFSYVYLSSWLASTLRKNRYCNCNLALDSSHGEMGKVRLFPSLYLDISTRVTLSLLPIFILQVKEMNQKHKRV